MKSLHAFLSAALVAAPMSVPALANDIPETASLRIIVDRSDRKAYVQREGEVIAVHDVAVGKSGYETPLGSWSFHQVDINPDWTPPDSDWSREAAYTPPGHPDNPMGRARLIFNRPYSIHGTRDEASLGQAASHGSIRAANPVVLDLARILLKEGGAWQDESWFADLLADPATMHEIPLGQPVPIDIVE